MPVYPSLSHKYSTFTRNPAGSPICRQRGACTKIMSVIAVYPFYRTRTIVKSSNKPRITEDIKFDVKTNTLETSREDSATHSVIIRNLQYFQKCQYKTKTQTLRVHQHESANNVPERQSPRHCSHTTILFFCVKASQVLCPQPHPPSPQLPLKIHREVL